MIANEAIDLAYRISWRSSSVRSGAHRSRLSGSLGLFRDLVPLMDEPDPRRIAVRASFADPFERLLVKRAERTGAITVNVLVDVSRSMSFAGRCRKLPIAGDLIAAIAGCARRMGDPFGVVAFDSKIVEEVSLFSCRSRSAQADVAEKLAAFEPQRPGVKGIAAAGSRLPKARSLVFLVSDFLWTAEEAELAASTLARHDILPLVLDDTAALDELPDWGLMSLSDLESGKPRTVFMRPQLKQRWRQERDESRRRVMHALSSVARAPLTITNAIDWDRLGAYLMFGEA